MVDCPPVPTQERPARSTDTSIRATFDGWTDPIGA